MPRPVLYALLVVYLVALALIALWPTTVDRGFEGQIADVIAWAHAQGLTFVTYRFIERLANVLMFVPFGLLLGGLLPRRHRGWGIAIAVLVSVGIEVAQLLFLPERFSTLSDVLSNSLGGALGVIAVIVLGMRRPRSARGRRVAAVPIAFSDRGEPLP